MPGTLYLDLAHAGLSVICLQDRADGVLQGGHDDLPRYIDVLQTRFALHLIKDGQCVSQPLLLKLKLDRLDARWGSGL